MSLKRPRGDPGTLVVLEHNSKILKGNPLGEFRTLAGREHRGCFGKSSGDAHVEFVR